MKNIFEHTWAIVLGIPTAVIAGLIVNSFTKWWTALATITNTGWAATSEAVAQAATYRAPLWAVAIAIALVILTRYVVRRINRTPEATGTQTRVTDFLTYRDDIFDGVICKWDYKQPHQGAPFRVENLLCYCQHCDFIIGTPNNHQQKCPSCSRRAVRSDVSPFFTNRVYPQEIAGYRRREDEMSFELFILLEMDRRIRKEERSQQVQAERT